MSTLAKAGVRLWAGSVRAYRQRAEQARTWVARARREDLEGWQASLGSWLRLAVLAGAGYAVFRACRAWPWLMWALAAWWVAVAWRAGAPRNAGKDTADEEAPAAGPAPVAQAVADTLLLDAVRALAQGGHGAHYEALAEHLTSTTGQAWDTAAVRAACRAVGIPHCGSVRQPGRAVSTGVRLADLPDPSPGPSQDPAVAVVVAGQDTPTAAATATTTAPATGDVRTVEGVRMTLLDDTENTARTHVTVHP